MHQRQAGTIAIVMLVALATAKAERQSRPASKSNSAMKSEGGCPKRGLDYLNLVTEAQRRGGSVRRWTGCTFQMATVVVADFVPPDITKGEQDGYFILRDRGLSSALVVSADMILEREHFLGRSFIVNREVAYKGLVSFAQHDGAHIEMPAFEVMPHSSDSDATTAPAEPSRQRWLVLNDSSAMSALARAFSKTTGRTILQGYASATTMRCEDAAKLGSTSSIKIAVAMDERRYLVLSGTGNEVAYFCKLKGWSAERDRLLESMQSILDEAQIPRACRGAPSMTCVE